MPRTRRSSVVNVSLVAVPQVSAGVVYGLHEVFSSVGVTWGQLTGDPNTPRRMATRVVAARHRTFRTELGAPIAADATFEDEVRTDIAIVADLNLSPDVSSVGLWPQASRWLRQQYEQGALVCSVCTGSLMLAEAGLLDGLEATSHWGASIRFRECYPEVRLTPEKVLLAAGDGHRIITGGGSSAWSDLALYLVARFCGSEEARRIARIYLFGDRADGQLPFAHLVRPAQHADHVVRRLQAWIADNYACANPVARLETVAGLRPRTLKRRFKLATGYTPIEYVQSLRVEQAKQLLETTHRTIEDVAADVGYVDPKSFRALFKRLVGISPRQYRRRFQPVGSFMSELTSSSR